MDFPYAAGYGDGSAYPGYYHGGVNVGFSTFPSVPYFYAPGVIRDRCLPEKQPESKPRLSKDEVEILEAHFRQNPKPPSSLKRELAERMGVELPRINNWFQNRRAKAKQERNQEEYRARQEAEAKADSRARAADNASSIQEHFALSNEEAPLQPCIAAFESRPTGNRRQSQALIEPQASQEVPGPTPQAILMPSPADELATTFCAKQVEEQPTSPAPVVEIDNGARQGMIDSETDLTMSRRYLRQPDDLGEMAGTFPDVDSIGVSAHNMGIGCDSTPSDAHQSMNYGNISTLTAASPPAPTEFKPPPPAAEIARRRNRRPLGLGPFSYHSQPFLKTGCNDNCRRSDASSPIRRIASATGCVPPRVVKPSTGSVPRSPMLSEHKREALIQSLHGPGSPALGLAVNSAVAVGPPTPRTPLNLPLQENGEQPSCVVPHEDGRSFAYPAQQTASFVRMDDPSMKTPPGTPGVMTFHEGMYPLPTIDSSGDFMAPQEELLFTPSVHAGFPSELDFSVNSALGAPEYVAASGLSQPVTPSLPTPTLASGCPRGGDGTGKYSWPDAALEARVSSSGSSPTYRSRTFQFTPNMTPQHFTVEK